MAVFTLHDVARLEPKVFDRTTIERRFAPGARHRVNGAFGGCRLLRHRIPGMSVLPFCGVMIDDFSISIGTPM